MSPERLRVGVAPNGHHFVDGHGRPFFWLGDTQWNLFRCHTLDEARLILENRKSKGFSFIQVMLRGWAKGVEAAPVRGEAFLGDDAARPNPEYFKHVDDIVRLAGALGLILVIGVDHPSNPIANEANARACGRWIGARYRAAPNIIWIPSYAIPDAAHLPIMREVVAGLQEGDGGGHLITSHPDPANPVISSSLAHDQPWLAFNCIQTFAALHLIHPTVTADYQRRPAKPVVMAEGAYEDGPEYGFPVTPLIIRRQAYWTYLGGGHHSYGHTSDWRVTPDWREKLDAPGAAHMAVLHRIFISRRWWELAPDQSIIASDAGSGANLNAAARSVSGDWLIVYLSSPSAISVRMDKLAAATKATASWIDPRTGAAIQIGMVPTSGAKDFASPAEWEDAVLIIEAQGRKTGV